MPVFTYEAVSDEGTVERGALNVADEVELEKMLARRKLCLVDATLGAGARHRGARIATRDLAELARYVAITCKGGLSLVESLDDFAQQSPVPAVKSVLAEVVKDVREGMTLSEAFGRHPRAFDDAVLALTRAGEASGQMEEVMRRLALQLEFELDVKSKVKGALIYPCVLGTAVLGLIILLITFLLPKIVGMLAQNDVKMPGPTQALLDLSGFITTRWPWLLAGLAATVGGFKFLKSTRRGAIVLNRILLVVPALGGLAKLGAQTRFAATLRTLLASGVEAVSALEMAADACGSPFYGARLRGAAAQLREGRTFSDVLSATGCLHPLVLRMVQLGERSGRMDETPAPASISSPPRSRSGCARPSRCSSLRSSASPASPWDSSCSPR